MTVVEPEPSDLATGLGGEIWKPAPGFEGFYEVSDFGRVRVLERWVNSGQGGRRLNRARILKPVPVGKGYFHVGMNKPGEPRTHLLLHSLVLETFIGPRPPDFVGCHIDGDPSNNRLDNLRWDTQKANMRDAREMGRRNFKRTEKRPKPQYTFADIEGEKWAALPGYEGAYEVSTCGRVKSLDRWNGNRLLRGQLIRSVPLGGYLVVSIRRPGQATVRYVHHLVLETFVGPRPEGYFACHNDGDPLNCWLDNLRWDTASNNQLDNVRNGTHRQARKTHCPAGHPYTRDNVIKMRYGRDCRICANERRRKGTPSAVEINRNKTHCVKGHEFTPENTRIRKATATHNGGRECRTCDRERLPQKQAARARRRAAAQEYTVD